MSVALLRVDERLIHGQVVVGWGSRLHPARIAVVDDELAASEWEQELYAVGLPTEIAAEFVSVARARDRIADWNRHPETIFVLTRDVATMAALARDGTLAGAEVNIGGIHHAPGRREALPYVFLSEQEEGALRELVAEGVRITARDLPGSRGVGVDDLLGGGRSA